MRQKRLFLLMVMGLALILAACSDGASESTAVSEGGDISGYEDLVDALEAEGATVEPAGEVEQAFFSVTGQIIKVNGADVQVFEYDDAAAREADSSQISPDGSSIGTTMVTWVDQPNFWAQDNLIVLYVGADTEILDLLTGVLGQPLTSG